MEENIQDVLPIYKELLFLENIAIEAPSPSKGQYNRAITILYDEKDDVPEAQTLLENILKACKVSMDDIYCFKISKADEVIAVLNAYPAEFIISFGIAIQNENMRHFASVYRPTTFKNAQIIYSDKLRDVNKNPEMKNKLWNGLQKFFKLNT